MDNESPEIWTQTFAEAGIDAGGRIIPQSDDNWWSNGPVGLCGPDTEIFVYVGDQSGTVPFADSPEFVEIWNNVFMAYDRSDDGRLEQLRQRNVDTGMGLERITAFLGQHNSVWDTDELAALRDEVAAALQIQVPPSSNGSRDRELSLRIVTDHLRAALVIAAAGIHPSASRQGYVLRKLVRRAVRHAELLRGTDDGLAAGISAATEGVSRVMADRWPDTGSTSAGEEARATIDQEASRFARTLREGTAQLHDQADRGSSFDGDLAFLLADTHGYPAELSVEEALRMGMTIEPGWEARFEELREAQRARSRR